MDPVLQTNQAVRAIPHAYLQSYLVSLLTKQNNICFSPGPSRDKPALK